VMEWVEDEELALALRGSDSAVLDKIVSVAAAAEGPSPEAAARDAGGERNRRGAGRQVGPRADRQHHQEAIR